MDLYAKRQIIDANYTMAIQNIPESLIPVKKMLYIDGKINNNPVKIFIDTGAQMSVMSLETAKLLKLDYLIDYHQEGFIVGVGHSTKVGKIHYLEIELDKGIKLPCSFTILKSEECKLILGLDVMLSQGCILDLKSKEMKFGGLTFRFDGY